MAIDFECRRCGRQGRADDKLAGRIVKCPACKEPIELDSGEQFDRDLDEFFEREVARAAPLELDPLPQIEERPPVRPVVAQTGPPKKRQPRFRLGALFEVTTLVVATVVFLASLRSDHVVQHYAALAALLFLGARRVALRWPGREVRWLAGIACLALLIAWWRVDYHVDRWSQAPGQYEVYEAHYTDYYRRGSYRPYYRKMSLRKPGSFLSWYHTEGAITETGKLHGKWTWVRFDWDARPVHTESGTDFYWYGEEVTEGTWHLRNQ